MALYTHAFRGAVRAAHTKSEGGLLRLVGHRPVTVNLPEANSESVEIRTGLLCIQCDGVLKRDAEVDGKFFGDDQVED